jgi:hypothetical protein
MGQALKWRFINIVGRMMPQSTEQREQRLAIAHDVIAQIKAKHFVAVSMRYVNFIINEAHLKLKQKGDTSTAVMPLQEVVKNAKVCEVCALGGLFLSYVNLYNDVNAPLAYSLPDTRQGERAESGENMTAMSPEGGLGSVARHPKLVELFGTPQLGLIETAFERVGHTYDVYIHNHNDEFTELARRALNFGRSYVTDHGRMLAIMRNIIKNHGVFIP